jgi:hypothetical protein
MLNERNQIHNFISSSRSGTVIIYGSGSDFLTNYSSGPVPLVKKLRFLRFRFRFQNTARASNVVSVTIKTRFGPNRYQKNWFGKDIFFKVYITVPGTGMLRNEKCQQAGTKHYGTGRPLKEKR